MKTIDQILEEIRAVKESLNSRKTALLNADSDFKDTEEFELLTEAYEFATHCENALESI